MNFGWIEYTETLQLVQHEDNGQINFLDFLLVRKDSKIDIGVL